MQRFEQIECIGTGAYSVVYKGIDRVTNQTVAIKQISHKNIDINQILSREVRILKQLNHPNIIKLLECFGDVNHTYLIFEYIPYDLITYYKKINMEQKRNLNDTEITFIFYQLCQALAYMHSKNLIHRDIKPENILIDPKNLHVKIIDFGFATENKLYSPNTNYMVTRWYRPLEIVLNLQYDFKADIFSLGAMMLQLYLGEQVFKSSSNINQLYWICDICGVPAWQPALDKMKQLNIFIPVSEPKIYKLVQKLRSQAKNLLLNMLQSSPVNRMSSFQALNHPYFYNYQPQRQRSARLNSIEDPRLSMNSKNNLQSRIEFEQRNQLKHVNSQPFFVHKRSLSQKDKNQKQISLSKQKVENEKINISKKVIKHVKTQTCDLKMPTFLASKRNTIESEKEKKSSAKDDKNRTRSLNPGLNLMLMKKNLKTKLANHDQARKHHPPMFSKIRNKLMENNRQSKQKYKISLVEKVLNTERKQRSFAK